MRNPTEVLKNLMEKSKNETYRFQRLYRNLYNPEFCWLAYKNIYANDGSMTAGADGTTIDGMGNERIERIILSLKDRSYQPKPARREYIAKKNSSKKRPLGIQSGDDKLVQEVVKMILESIYEPVFSNKSHGFRPNRSCQTALKQMVALHWEKYMQHIRDKYNSIYKIQMPKITPHVCRHTFCSNMAKSGMNPKTLQYIMGHSDISVTLNTYTHVNFEDAKDEMRRVAGA